MTWAPVKKAPAGIPGKIGEAVLVEVVRGAYGQRYGGIYQFPDESILYIAIRSTERGKNGLYKSRRSTLSEAKTDGVLCWAIDHETVRMLKRRDIATLAIWCRKEERLYQTAVASFDTRKECDEEGRPCLLLEDIDWSERGGSEQRLLPIQHWVGPTHAPLKKGGREKWI